jgi:penicillin-binding protein 2
MYTEKRRLSKNELKRISFTTNIVLGIIFIILLFAFWNAQILKKYFYTRLASQNIIKEIEVKAPRGLILDRNGERLADNKLNFTLFLVREYSQNLKQTIQTAHSILGRDIADIEKKIKKYRHYPRSFMIPLEKDLPLEKVIYIESRSDELPEFKIEIEPARAYPFQETASHILGYISELTSTELERRKGKGYSLGDIVGKNGIERQYESSLQGQKGVRTVARDNLGRIRETLNEKNPVIGNSVVLTIDVHLQKYIEEIFEDNTGAVGVVELKTGDILAMVSMPNYNPEFFSGVLDQKEWLSLINDPNKPLHNKFLQGIYSPGSVFKIVVALAGLQENIIDVSTISQCYGSVRIYDRNFSCWRAGGHGALDIYGALEHSCNVYFYRVGKKLDIDVLAKYANMMGMGRYTDIDLPNEVLGLVPTKAWKLKEKGQKWFPGETISVAIGGGMINTTPIEVLSLISTVALRGKRPQLHLLKAIKKGEEVVKTFEPKFYDVSISRENFETVIEGLYRAVNAEGTSLAAKIKGLNVCGKTGTQQIISKENPNYKNLVKQKKYKPHSWFVSFAPRENPEIAMVVFVEHGGDAGAIAAPIAGKIYRKIF